MSNVDIVTSLDQNKLFVSESPFNGNCDSIPTPVNGDFEGPKSRLHSKISYFQSCVISATSMHEITLYAKDMHKNRFITIF